MQTCCITWATARRRRCVFQGLKNSKKKGIVVPFHSSFTPVPKECLGWLGRSGMPQTDHR